MAFLYIFFLLLSLSTATTDVASCSCGFLDRTGAIWTDAIIAYGNETDKLPSESLVTEDFQHPYEKNWNARYRAGARSSNLGHNKSTAPGWNGSAWVLNLDRPTKDHTVVGTSLRTVRRDIQYGTFEAVLGPPKPGVGGSILAMRLDYSESQTVNLNVMNADDPDDAWTSFMLYGDWRGTRSKGVNFTDFGNDTYKFGGSPWGFVPYRIDWTASKANFFIGDALARSVSPRHVSKPWPTTPSTLYFRHTSIGDMYTSEGPPPNGSHAHVGLVRAFFNSSLMTWADHDSFDKRCHLARPCLVSDISLRGSSPYGHGATREFKPPSINYKKRWPAIFVASISLAISILLLGHALFKRGPWNKTDESTRTPSQDLSTTPSMIFSEGDGLTYAAQGLGIGTPGQVTPGNSTPSRVHSETAWLENGTSAQTLFDNSRPVTRPGSSALQVPLPPFLSYDSRRSSEITVVNEKKSAKESVDQINEKKQPEVAVKEMETKPTQGANPPIAVPKQRVDYLAGLVALASVLVTLIHFALTFLPATEIPYTHTHYQSEMWALKIVTPYLLTFSWIGPFFTSSTRFLVGNYLKSGNLKNIAEKTVGRTPRLIIPCAAIAALEYFCMQVGAIKWLEYLPSVTWSTWPYTASYVTFGHFLNEIIELMYIIPNAVPQITFNYCIGVLWTIPVQLQNSWLSLLAVMVIREIKTPWKRMGYYAFCIANHWYALSWGSFFWVGLLIADLDITYKWKTWLNNRPVVYYVFITFCTLLAAGSPSIDLVSQWKPWNFNTLESGVHPHQRTGNLIRDTYDYGYPAYYQPRLTALTFSIGFHLLVELSPLVQKFFSNCLLMWLFPHILTLYLIHGLVFWSLGAVICVHLAAHGVPYWANMLVVAICTYTVIFACLPILTPVIETLGKSITTQIWQNASEKPLPRRKTLYPFGPELFKDAESNDTEVRPKGEDVERNDAETGRAL
ncbi:hypothetical protein BCR34DRAFT_540400 [Clohesyomyces aquaticus]|uniref:GH16 domain-containing protein n=1 Tax=Clohesyomyces aquaticus TaxID=1231657 RepID=A0A1Y1ZHM2_9PLEO|nr:hypothetical protein BCR34DRAFT_540400 [Clohesyomyces aquaticus]